MKRVYVLLVVTVLAIAVSAVVWAAQEQAPPPEPQQAGGWTGPTAIAVSGGDVYVVAKGLLLKYDTELNLVKQATLPAVQGPMVGERRRMGGREGGGGRGGGGRGGGMRRGGGGRM
jgi:uncharacterized membrane protein YgcG